MKRRRVALGLSLGSMGCLAVVALYQTGIIRHLPELPVRPFDSEQAVSAPHAYTLMSTPDAMLGLVSYATTGALIAMGPPNRAWRHPWMPLLMTLKGTADVVQASRLTARQVRDESVLCSWCLAAGAASVLSLALMVPEAVEGAGNLIRRQRPPRLVRSREFGVNGGSRGAGHQAF